MNTIGAERVGEWQGRIVDVRTLNEFAGERLPRAECVPLDGLMSVAGGWDRSERLLVMCKSGMRSKQAADELIAAGFANITMLSGGIEACKKAGLEVVVTRKTIPIIRQVMIVAGTLLLIGLALSRVNPWFALIDWFVAGGLLVAGLTGSCLMAKLLERMPWNASPSCHQTK